MNGQQQAALAERFSRLLREAGVKVQRAVVVSGNLKSWEDIPAEGLIGRWLQNGWRVVVEDVPERVEVPDAPVRERMLDLIEWDEAIGDFQLKNRRMLT